MLQTFTKIFETTMYQQVSGLIRDKLLSQLIDEKLTSFKPEMRSVWRPKLRLQIKFSFFCEFHEYGTLVTRDEVVPSVCWY